MRDFLVLPVLIFIIPMVLRYPFVGIMLWGWTSFLVPNFYLYGFLSGFPFAKGIAVATIISLLINKDKQVRKPHIDASFGLFIVFSIHMLISALTTISTMINPWIYYEKVVKAMVYCLFASAVMTTRFRIHCMLAAVALGLSFHGVLEAGKFVLSAGAHHVIGPNMDNNDFAVVVLMTLPILSHLTRYSENKAVRLAWLGLLVVSTVTVVATMSRGGFIGLVTISGWLIMRSPKRWSILIKLVPVALLLFSIAPDRWFERIETVTEANEDASFMGRVKAWKLSTLIALDHPVFGGGLHALQDYGVWTHYTQSFHTLDFVQTGMPDPNQAHAAHSIYFEVLGDLGFVGLGLFLAIAYSGWRNASTARRLCNGRPEMEWLEHLAFMLQLSLLAYMVSAAALSLAYYEIFYLTVALLSILRRMAESHVAAHDPVPCPLQAPVAPLARAGTR